MLDKIAACEWSMGEEGDLILQVNEYSKRLRSEWAARATITIDEMEETAGEESGGEEDKDEEEFASNLLETYKKDQMMKRPAPSSPTASAPRSKISKIVSFSPATPVDPRWPSFSVGRFFFLLFFSLLFITPPTPQS